MTMSRPLHDDRVMTRPPPGRQQEAVTCPEAPAPTAPACRWPVKLETMSRMIKWAWWLRAGPFLLQNYNLGFYSIQVFTYFMKTLIVRIIHQNNYTSKGLGSSVRLLMTTVYWLVLQNFIEFLFTNLMVCGSYNSFQKNILETFDQKKLWQRRLSSK